MTTLEPIHCFGMPDLHVVSFDRPWPPSYGGIVDVFWKIAALEKRGVQIRLHYLKQFGTKEKLDGKAN